MSLAVSGGTRCCRRALQVDIGIDPAGVHPSMERVGSFGIDVSLPHDAAESRLDMSRRTAEPIVEIEVAKGRVEIVTPKEAYHAASEPQAFRASGSSPQNLLRFGKFVDSLLRVLAVRRLRLFRRFLVRGLGNARICRKKQRRRTDKRYDDTQTNDTHGSSGLGPLQPDHCIPMPGGFGSIAARLTLLAAD
jgi:hypothetical protein